MAYCTALTFTAQLIYSLSANGHCESRLSQREHQKRKGRKERRQRDGRLSEERTANRLRMVWLSAAVRSADIRQPSASLYPDLLWGNGTFNITATALPDSIRSKEECVQGVTCVSLALVHCDEAQAAHWRTLVHSLHQWISSLHLQDHHTAPCDVCNSWVRYHPRNNEKHQSHRCRYTCSPTARELCCYGFRNIKISGYIFKINSI